LNANNCCAGFGKVFACGGVGRKVLIAERVVKVETVAALVTYETH
jgi:hypothetical protein